MSTAAKALRFGACAAERGQAKPGFDVQALCLLDRFAEEERGDGVAYRGDQAPLHGRPKAQALAISDQAGPGSHLAKDEIQRIGDAGRSGKPQGDRVYAIDDHGNSVDAGSLAVRFLFAATRRAAASATRAHVASSSGSSNSRSGVRQKERSMVQPFFS